MKTKFLFVLLFSIIFNGIAIAAEKSNEPLNKVIRKSISYPTFAKEARLHGVVLVEYRVNPTGQVTVTKINASNQRLGRHVKNELEKLVLNDNRTTGVHFAKFSFKYVDL